ncbi:MAG: glycosyltransferase family 39 protein [Candidatus Hydrogenedentes bacterium]|nr:glycosyltransferase family 39 protein [Candidatus Hydrogenedentota bacterium]
MGSVQFILLLAVLAAFSAFFELGRRDVTEDNEGQRATPPAEMIRSGNYVIPTINGKDYLNKPPLLYWAIAGVYKLTGDVSPLTARIPTALAYVALVFTVYLAGRRALGEHAARWGALAMLVSPYVMERGRYAELDIPLTLAMFLAIVAAHAAVLTASKPRAAVLVGFDAAIMAAADAPKARAALLLVRGVTRAAVTAASKQRTALLVVTGGVAFGAGILLKGPVPFLFLAAAFIAQLALMSDNLPRWSVSSARWTIRAMLVGIAGWLASLAAVAMGWPPGILGFLTPAALLLMVGAWLIPAWRNAGPAKWRCAGVFAGISAVGLLVFAPWGAAVLARKGLPYVIGLLQSESLQRTHTATAINSGSPFYYVFGLIGMMIPWGLLLPCHMSRQSWKDGPAFYRFSVFAGWLSVAIFSLIAGKEYEYVLPALPLLLLATGWQLAQRIGGQSALWVTRWHEAWQGAMLPLLALATLGFLITVFVKSPGVWVQAVLVAVAALACITAAWRNFERRTAILPLLALCASMMWLLSQDYRYTGQRSFRPLAQTAGRLLKAGYDVEAVKMTAAFDVYPGFAFHAGTAIPTTTDPENVRRKLLDKKPYYCVVRQKMLDEARASVPAQLAKPLMGPLGTKKLILIGNAPLPLLGRD